MAEAADEQIHNPHSDVPQSDVPQSDVPQSGQSHFAIQADLKPPRGLVSLKGDLDMATAPRLEAVVNWLATRVQIIEFDCSDVTFVDVAGIRPILALHGAGCEAWVVKPSQSTELLLELIDQRELVSQANGSNTTVPESSRAD